MPDLVGDDELEQPAREGIREREGPGARIELRRLREIPIAIEVHHVLENARRAVEDFTGARIADVRANGIFCRARQPADDRVADVFRRPIGIIGGRVHCDDPVFEAGGFECGLPIVDRVADPRLPLFRCIGVDIVHDRLLWCAETVRVGCAGALQTILGDVLAARGAAIGAKVHETLSEKADAFVKATRHHRVFGKANDAPMREHTLRGTRCATELRDATGSRSRASLGSFDFDIFREGYDALDK